MEWAHLDIAGTAWDEGANKGSTGRPVSLLIDLLGLTKALDKQVLFYNLQDDNQVDKSICRITNFYYKKKLKILIIGEDKSQIDTLNDLLWTFEQISFLPHSFESEYESTPIVLCMIDNLQSILNKYKFDVLFNLSRNKINLDMLQDIL